jgi:hypothetical protein
MVMSASEKSVIRLDKPRNVEKKHRTSRPKKSEAELVQNFWAAPVQAFFGQESIAAVIQRNVKTLESDRWRGIGIAFRKCSGRVLYRKSDVIAWLEGHELVASTSQYKFREVSHVD